jgi:hypothetical protein
MWLLLLLLLLPLIVCSPSLYVEEHGRFVDGLHENKTGCFRPFRYLPLRLTR